MVQAAKSGSVKNYQRLHCNYTSNINPARTRTSILSANNKECHARMVFIGLALILVSPGCSQRPAASVFGGLFWTGPSQTLPQSEEQTPSHQTHHPPLLHLAFSSSVPALSSSAEDGGDYGRIVLIKGSFDVVRSLMSEINIVSMYIVQAYCSTPVPPSVPVSPLPPYASSCSGCLVWHLKKLLGTCRKPQRTRQAAVWTGPLQSV